MKKSVKKCLLALIVFLISITFPFIQVLAEEVIDSDQQEVTFELYDEDQAKKEISPTQNGQGDGRFFPLTGSVMYGIYSFLGTLLIGLTLAFLLKKRMGKDEKTNL